MVDCENERMIDRVRQQVMDVYAAVDEGVASAGPRCDSSGRCCRFTEYGHTLFISQFEAEILLESAPAYSVPVSRDGCPFQVEGLCTMRAARPLGCRIYFCDPSYQSRMVEITEESIARLKQIADAHDTGWHYAPLHHFLNARAQSAPGDTPNTRDSRYPLPILVNDK